MSGAAAGPDCGADGGPPGDRDEDALVATILAAAAAAGAATRGPRVVLGPGDDAAVLAPPPGHDLVWTVDDQVEDVHGRRAWGLEALGRKAVGAALSDLAAMGARPLGALLALHLPPDLLRDRHAVAALARGAGRGLAAAGCPLLGGNVTRHPSRLAVSTSALGAVPAGRALRRDAARAGDGLFVAGPLGLARLGLRWLEAGGDPRDPAAAPAVEALLAPAPRLRDGLALLALPRAACLDVSDGLARDLPRLLRASGVAAVVDGAALPAPPAALAARLLGPGAPDADPPALAWLGGEDYALLVAAPPADVAAAGLGAALAPIGRVVEGPPGAVRLEGPLAGRALGPGFDHLA